MNASNNRKGEQQWVFVSSPLPRKTLYFGGWNWNHEMRQVDQQNNHFNNIRPDRRGKRWEEKKKAEIIP